jgi:hypothetical protein
LNSPTSSEGKTITYHISIGLDGLIDMLIEQRDKKGGQSKTDLFNPNPTIDQALEQCLSYKNKGYQTWPMCKHINKEGDCLGHE